MTDPLSVLKRASRFIWPVIGIAALGLSVMLLTRELRGISLEDLGESFAAVSLGQWLLAILATFGAYGALSAYDHLALTHLGRKVGILFITACSMTTYAISHNLGAAAVTGAIVRYRAYSSKGLSGPEVGVLVTFCSVTFFLGTILLTGLVLVFDRDLDARFVDLLPVQVSGLLGWGMLALVALYLLGSAMKLRPLMIGKFQVSYPRVSVALRQIAIAPTELIFAAAIIYFAMPDEGNPGFGVVLGVFLASFTLALLSHAPGGLGVLELVFVTALPEMRPEDVLAALLVFRILYFIIPFVIALGLIVAFERAQFLKEKPLEG